MFLYIYTYKDRGSVYRALFDLANQGQLEPWECMSLVRQMGDRLEELRTKREGK